MVNKKYLLLAGLCSTLVAQPAFAQDAQTETGAKWSSRDMTYRGQGYDVLDSSYVPKSRMDQHRKYLNHQYAFPAKPKNMWEIGVGAGLYNIMGDVSTSSFLMGDKGGFGFHAHVRKAWGYVFSTRLQYIYGVGVGRDHNYSSPEYVSAEPVWNGNNNGTGGNLGWNYADNTAGSLTRTGNVIRNYRTEAHSINFDVIASITNIRFHRAKTGVSLYGFVGIGGTAYKTKVNALDANFEGYDFDVIQGAAANAANPGANNGTGLADTRENRKDFRKNAQNNMDDTYETDAFRDLGTSDRPTILDDKLIAFTPSVGIGAQFRFSKRVNLSIEDRYSMTAGDDLLDGHRFGGQSLTPSPDGINYLSIGLNFNLGNARKSVEPLYWMNPLDHAYNELSYPRHMMLPDPVLPDADGDGITDQFDKCPGTPAGVAVDAHGCPMDTDGDGVPDDRDKQLITPTECQPVDADGVGKCPCPDGCGGQVSACSNIGAGSVTFDNNASKIRPAAQGQLSALAAQMQANPTCKVVIVGGGNASKVQQQRSWDRVNAIIEYMSEKNGIDRNRFIFQYGQAGDANSVMYRSALAGEEGPANVAPPFPNLKRD